MLTDMADAQGLRRTASQHQAVHGRWDDEQDRR